jgi:hypothetical protein
VIPRLKRNYYRENLEDTFEINGATSINKDINISSRECYTIITILHGVYKRQGRAKGDRLVYGVSMFFCL